MMQWFIHSPKGGPRGYDALAKEVVRPCREWTGFRDRHGFCRVHFRLPDGRIESYASRLAFFKAFSILPKGSVVRHLCGNLSCVEPTHLILGVPSSDALETVAKTKQWYRLSPTELLRLRGTHAKFKSKE